MEQSIFFSLFLKLDSSMEQFKFPLLFAVTDFWSRGNILSQHEDLSLLRLVRAKSIYIKVCFRETWKKIPYPYSYEMQSNTHRLLGIADTEHLTSPFLQLNLIRLIGQILLTTLCSYPAFKFFSIFHRLMAYSIRLRSNNPIMQVSKYTKAYLTSLCRAINYPGSP